MVEQTFSLTAGFPFRDVRQERARVSSKGVDGGGGEVGNYQYPTGRKKYARSQHGNYPRTNFSNKQIPLRFPAVN